MNPCSASLSAHPATAVGSVYIISASAEESIRDINDRPILRAAISANADIFLTGDKDFLESDIKSRSKVYFLEPQAPSISHLLVHRNSNG